MGSNGEWSDVDAAEFLSVYSLTCRADDLALIFSEHDYTACLCGLLCLGGRRTVPVGHGTRRTTHAINLSLCSPSL